MTDPYLITRFSEIDTAIQKVRSSSVVDVQLQTYLVYYLVVMIAGSYEETVEYLVRARAGKAGDADVENFVRECVDKIFRSPKFENIKELVGLFGESYRIAFQKQVDEKSRTALGSIVTNRNSIAHGKPIAVTVRDVESFHNNSRPVFEALENILS